MPYITVKQYAKLKHITVQAVYSNIKKGILKSLKQVENGKTQLCVEITEGEFKTFESNFNDDLKEVETDFKTFESDFVEYLKAENARKDKIIDELNQQIERLHTQLSEYTLRFAELADKAITTTSQAQVLQAVDKTQNTLIEGENEQPKEEEKKPGFFSRIFKKN